MSSLLSGVIAGLAIAIPVGAIALLILYIAADHGVGRGMAAAFGAATVDTSYATVAVTLGAVIAPLIAVAQEPLRYVSAGILLVLAVGIMRPIWRRTDPDAAARPSWFASSGLRVYLGLVALTVVNPATIIYFMALTTGNTLGDTATLADRAWFVVGVALGSGSWHAVLAVVGATLSRFLRGEGARRWTAIVGGFLMVGLAIRTLVA
ncbi:MAG: LysE family transporter [Salinibacterium sp.]|nr:LysE family transporter [Salinibacterium sp.]MBF0672225.1 LysE family transporter [Salinibacterium sp.]